MTTRDQHLIECLAHRIEAVRASRDRCSALWRGLVSGELELAQTVAQERISTLILRVRARPSRPLNERAREILERTLLGERRKVIAYDMNVAPSTLAFTLKESLASFGLHCKASSVPTSLVVLVHAARSASDPSDTFIGDCEFQGRRTTVLTHVLRDSVLSELPPGERAVARLIASGRSCTDVAALRSRSYRTVINQVAAACRRLGVSGRLELLHRLATHALVASRIP